ncbi:MAG: hypothetical protein FWB71_03805 [Defluviitaleaceae bacterium]|nr:hypothetical protein [Defluviitaleaceae bacterium]
MAVKSYKDRIKTNWDTLSPQRQAELRDIWSEHMADCIIARIKEYPAKYQSAIFSATIKQMAEQ